MAWAATDAQVADLLADHPDVVAGCQAVAEAVVTAARSIALREAYDTGAMVAGMSVIRLGSGWRARSAVLHAAPVEGGTGIYGPKRRVIRSKSGKKMAFTTRLPPPPGSQGQAKAIGGVERKVVVAEHRGMEGRHVMDRAARSVAALPGLRYRVIAWEPTA